MSNIRVERDIDGKKMQCEPSGQVRWRKPKEKKHQKSSRAFDPPSIPAVLQQQFLIVELHKFVWLDVETIEED